MPVGNLLKIGDVAPRFAGDTDVNSRFAFGAMGGRWVVLLFFGSLDNAVGAAADRAVRKARLRLGDEDASYFGVPHP